MSYVLIEDVPASWERYEIVARSVASSAPGLVLHAAGPTDEGFRIIEIWESEAAWHAFEVGFDAVLEAIDPEVPTRPVVRDLHLQHLILGDSWAATVDCAGMTRHEGSTR